MLSMRSHIDSLVDVAVLADSSLDAGNDEKRFTTFLQTLNNGSSVSLKKSQKPMSYGIKKHELHLKVYNDYVVLDAMQWSVCVSGCTIFKSAGPACEECRPIV